MGRVARYKKLKSCDPFAKNGGTMTDMWGEGNNGQRAKKRSLTSQKLRSKRKRGAFSEQQEETGFDLPPSGKDDFDIHDLVGSLKKEKPEEVLKEDAVDRQANKRLRVEVAAGPQQALSLDKETREAKILKINLNQKKEQLVVPRMDGESKKAFYKRMQTEVKRAIRNEKIEETSNPEKKQRKKEFLKLKKQKKKKGRNIEDGEMNKSGYGSENEFNGLVTGERAAAVQKVAFGEQVERPPTFQVLPRGATAKKSNTGGKSNNSMSSAQQHAEQRSMEKMREMVQARYALIKAQTKMGIKGSF
jgi:hypothetical protein